MDEDHEHDWEAVPLTCFACQKRDAEQRRIQDDVAQRVEEGNLGAKAALDGLMIAIAEKGVTSGR